MLEAIVVLYLTTWDADTGVKLAYSRIEFTVGGNPIEACRRSGLRWAHKLTKQYRAEGYPNSFTNVDCQWERATT